MKQMKKLAALLAAAVLSLALLTGCGGPAASPAEGPSSAAASRSGIESEVIPVTFRITGPDGSVSEMALTANPGDTLASALLAAGVIGQEEADAGYVTVVNGIAADYNADRAWWALVDANGEMTAGGIATIRLAGGDVYGFVYTVD